MARQAPWIMQHPISGRKCRYVKVKQHQTFLPVFCLLWLITGPANRRRSYFKRKEASGRFMHKRRRHGFSSYPSLTSLGHLSQSTSKERLAAIRGTPRGSHTNRKIRHGLLVSESLSHKTNPVSAQVRAIPNAPNLPS